VRGGLDTTISGIATTLWLLATNADRWEAVRRDPSLLPGACEEALRLESPTSSIYRTTTAHAEIAGIRLIPDTKVQLFIGAANRDERQFVDPDKFDLQRFAQERQAPRHLGRGQGIHCCVGAALPVTPRSVVVAPPHISPLFSRVDSVLDVFVPGPERPPRFSLV
jgi:cytochrome P450